MEEGFLSILADYFHFYWSYRIRSKNKVYNRTLYSNFIGQVIALEIAYNEERDLRALLTNNYREGYPNASTEFLFVNWQCQVAAPSLHYCIPKF